MRSSRPPAGASARASRGARNEPMLPAPTCTTVAGDTSDMGLFLLGPPGRFAGQGGRVVADAALRRKGPAAPGRPPLRGLELVEPARAAGTLHRRLAVLDGAAADGAGARPGAGLGPEDEHGRRRLRREVEPQPADEDLVAVLQHAKAAE